MTGQGVVTPITPKENKCRVGSNRRCFGRSIRSDLRVPKPKQAIEQASLGSEHAPCDPDDGVADNDDLIAEVECAERGAHDAEVERHPHQHDRSHSEVADHGVELGATDRLVAVAQLSDDADKT